MAIKDQCANCKYKSLSDNCSIKGYLTYDSSSCYKYAKKGIDLSKQDSKHNQSNYENQTISPTQPAARKRMFQHPFSFKGRIRRLEYCLSYLVYFIYAYSMNVMDENEISPEYAIVWLMLLIPIIWFLWAQGAKRCHDRDNSGWYQIIPFYIFWMWFAEGDNTDNYYGEPPK